MSCSPSSPGLRLALLGLDCSARHGPAFFFCGAKAPGGLSCLVSSFVLVFRLSGCLPCFVPGGARFVRSSRCGWCRWFSAVAFLSGGRCRSALRPRAFALLVGRFVCGLGVVVGVLVPLRSLLCGLSCCGCFVLCLHLFVSFFFPPCNYQVIALHK